MRRILSLWLLWLNLALLVSLGVLVHSFLDRKAPVVRLPSSEPLTADTQIDLLSSGTNAQGSFAAWRTKTKTGYAIEAAFGQNQYGPTTRITEDVLINKIKVIELPQGFMVLWTSSKGLESVVYDNEFRQKQLIDSQAKQFETDKSTLVWSGSKLQVSRIQTNGTLTRVRELGEADEFSMSVNQKGRALVVWNQDGGKAAYRLGTKEGFYIEELPFAVPPGSKLVLDARDQALLAWSKNNRIYTKASKGITLFSKTRKTSFYADDFVLSNLSVSRNQIIWKDASGQAQAALIGAKTVTALSSSVVSKVDDVSYAKQTLIVAPVNDAKPRIETQFCPDNFVSKLSGYPKEFVCQGRSISTPLKTKIVDVSLSRHKNTAVLTWFNTEFYQGKVVNRLKQQALEFPILEVDESQN